MLCPSLLGPTVVNRTQIEFYCDVNTTVTDARARFNVSFVFDFEPDLDVPSKVLDVTNLRATLHERYLAGRLNKAVRLLLLLLLLLKCTYLSDNVTRNAAWHTDNGVLLTKYTL